MSHFCEFCQAWHSSASCHHPANRDVRGKAEIAPDDCIGCIHRKYHPVKCGGCLRWLQVEVERLRAEIATLESRLRMDREREGGE
jgi:hypothetical protein